MWSAFTRKPTKRRLPLIHRPTSKRSPLRIRLKLLLLLLFDLFSQSLQSKEQNLVWFPSQYLIVNHRMIYLEKSASIYLIGTSEQSNFQCRRHVTTSVAIPAILAIIHMSSRTVHHSRQRRQKYPRVSQMNHQNIMVPSIKTLLNVFRPWLPLCHPRLGQL